MSTAKLPALDLTQRPSRSPRCRLDGYALLPRPLDRHLLNFIGRAPKPLLAGL